MSSKTARVAFALMFSLSVLSTMSDPAHADAWGWVKKQAKKVTS